MSWKIFWVTFAAIFLAELGDKTQLAALTLSAESRSPLTVFLGASAALCLVTLLGVILGGVASQWIPGNLLKKVAGMGFVVMGGLMLWGKW